MQQQNNINGQVFKEQIYDNDIKLLQNTQNYRIRMVPIENKIIEHIFDFENNEVVAECTFDSVKRYYESMLDV